MTLDETLVWWADQDEMADLRFLCELRDQAILRDFVLKERQFHQLHDFRDSESPPPRTPPLPNLADTISNLVHCEANAPRGNERELKTYRDRYRKLVDERLLQPLINAALRDNDPLDANVRLILAQIYRQLHLASPAVSASLLAQVCAGRAEGKNELISGKQLAEMRSLVEMAIKMGKHFQQEGRNGWS